MRVKSSAEGGSSSLIWQVIQGPNHTQHHQKVRSPFACGGSACSPVRGPNLGPERPLALPGCHRLASPNPLAVAHQRRGGLSICIR